MSEGADDECDNLGEISIISHYRGENSQQKGVDQTHSQHLPGTLKFQQLVGEFIRLEVLFRETEDRVRTDIVSLGNDIENKQKQNQLLACEIRQAKVEMNERKKDIATLLTILKGSELSSSKAMSNKSKRSDKSGHKSTSKGAKSQQKKSPRKIK